MTKMALERELLAVVKQIEEDLSRPCSPQEMQWFVDQSLDKLAHIEKHLVMLIQKKESRLKRFAFDAVVVMSLVVIVFYTVMK